jgi:hypothetical protein
MKKNRIANPTRDKLFGRAFIPSTHGVVIELGDLHITRKQLVDNFDSASYRAAANLTKIFKKYKIRTPQQIAGHGIRWWFNVGGVGTESFWILMNILNAHGFDPERWVGGESENLVTLATMSRRNAKAPKTKLRKVS